MRDTSQPFAAAMVASLLWGAVLPASAAATARPVRSLQQEDTLQQADTLHEDTLMSDRDSAVAAHAVQLDSLRQRMTQLRAELVRLRLEFGARLQRLRDGLRIDVPVSVPDDEEAGVREGREALERVASIARRYYPEARVAVVGSAPGRGESCGTPAERRRAGAVVRYLTGPGGVDRSRVRRADCDRALTRSGRSDSPAARAESAVTLVLTFRGG